MGTESEIDLIEIEAKKDPGDPNLHARPRGTIREELERFNQAELLKLQESSVRTGTRVSAASFEEASQIINWIIRHEVTGPQSIDRYDPTTRTGFCFGRAEACKIELLYRNVAKDGIRKIWVTGHLRSHLEPPWTAYSYSIKDGGAFDAYHVATMVRAKEGGWWVIDPLLGRPMRPEQWYAIMQKWEAGDGARLHITDAKRVFPSDPRPYNRNRVERRDIIPFFDDLMRNFRARGAGSGERLLECASYLEGSSGE